MADATTGVEPRPIKRLSETLINRIAAGEIIHRPASALKELIENSLDAGSTSIKVTVKDGGLKLLQIQDNGHGIRKSDLPILAERFTTSKITSFSDLSRIATYGFRGEALASISHVARLSVTTKTKKDGHAWKATYSDGALVPAKAGQSADPKPSAGNDGTIITIEDLFYNTPTRLSALRSASEEYARILDVVTKYAIHNSRVSFQCKKAGSSSPELTTPANSTIPQAIKLLYGHAIANELLHVDVTSSGDQDPDESMDVDEEDEDDMYEKESWKSEVYFTNANYQAKKTNFLLFINHRLVESSRMKRAVEAVYTSILPKGASPFVYLSLEVDPKDVDVNVHPTKKEVHFLNEEGITSTICSAMQATLAKQATSRTFATQTLLTGHLSGPSRVTVPSRTQSASLKGKEKAIVVDEDEYDDDGEEEQVVQDPAPSVAPSKPKVYPHHKVRTNLQDRTLDSMFPVTNPTQLTSTQTQSRSKLRGSSPMARPAQPQDKSSSESSKVKIRQSEVFLVSIKKLRQQVENARHNQLTEIFEKHSFVGIVDLDKCLSLLQFSTNLYMVNHAAVAEEFFYQLGLRQFGDMSRLKLEPPPPIQRLVEIAVDAEDTSSTSLSKAEIVQKITTRLISRRDMLAEYFSFEISEDGHVLSLPLLLKDYVPNLDNLPNFLMRLGPQVDWTSEAECFETFLRELAYFYTPLSLTGSFVNQNAADQEKAEAAERWQIQHVVFPAMRKYFIAPKSLLDRDVVQVASLPELYKVFERC